MAKRKKEGIDQDTSQRDLPSCVCFNIRKTARAVTQFYDKAMKETGLQGTQFTLLAVGSQLGTSTMAELSRALVMDRTTLTRNLRPLEKKGLLFITKGNDQRTRQITLSQKGEKILSEAYPIWQKTQNHLTDALSKERWSSIQKDLEILIKKTLEA